MTSAQYAIRSNVSMLFDSPQHIDFHIQTGDYFSYLATMLGFLEEALELRDGEIAGPEKAMARELRTDLRYVQANYKIVARAMNEIQPVRPRGNLLEKKELL